MKRSTILILALAIGLVAAAVLVGGETPAAPAVAAPAAPSCEYTYQNFGAAFLAKHCLECHASKKTGGFSRKGAPKELNFDDVKIVAAKKARLIERVSVKKNMPPWFAYSPKPEDKDAAKFKAWLECEYK